MEKKENEISVQTGTANDQTDAPIARRMSGWWYRGCALILLSAALMVGSAGAAYAKEGKVWLNWVHMEAEGYKYAAYKYLYKTEAEPLNYRWACANMWAEKYYVFSAWYCGAPGTAGTTPELVESVHAEAAAANKSVYGQDIWAWEYEI